MKPLTLAFCLLAATAQAQFVEPLGTTVGDLKDVLSDKPNDSVLRVYELKGEEHRELQIVGVDQVTPWVTRILLVDAVPTPAPAPTSGPKGFGLMQGGNRNNPLTDAQFKHPKIDFLVFRDRWNRMEPTNDAFNFSYNAGQIRRARKIGKPYIWGNMTGSGSSPDHVAGPRHLGMVVPWAPTIGPEYRKLVYAVANCDIDGVKVKDDPLLAGVWITGPTVASQEMHMNGMEGAPGFSPAGIVANFKASIDAHREFFPRTNGILSISGQKAVQPYQGQVIAYMQQKYGKALANFQHNSLGTQTTVSATHHRTLLDLHRQGWKVGAEMVQPGHTSALGKFPEATYRVLYPGDEASLPNRVTLTVPVTPLDRWNQTNVIVGLPDGQRLTVGDEYVSP